MSHTSYEALLTPHRKSEGAESSELLYSNAVAYQSACRYWMQTTLAMLGGYDPSMDLDKPFATSDDIRNLVSSIYAESIDQKKKKGKKGKKENVKKPKITKTLMASREVFAFSCWFVPMSKKNEPSNQIKQKDLMKRFQKYWGSYDDYDQHLIEELCNFYTDDETTVWTDQRKSFEKLNKVLKILDDELARWFRHNAFPLVEDTGAEKYCRSFLSDIWGDPDSKTPIETVRKYPKVLHLLQSDVVKKHVDEEPQNLSSDNVYYEIHKKVGVSQEPLSVTLKARGRPSRAVLLLKKIENGESVEIKVLQSAFAELVKTFSDSQRFSQWAKNLRKHFEGNTGIVYHQKKRLQGIVGEMLHKTWRAIKPHHTNVSRQLIERLVLKLEIQENKAEELYKKHVTLADDFSKYMMETQGYEKYSIRTKQTNGIKDFFVAMNDDGGSVDTVIENMQAEGKRVNYNLLNWLALHAGGENPQKLEDGLKLVAKVHTSQERLEKLRYPRISLPTMDNPWWQQFGSADNYGSVTLLYCPIEEHHRYNPKYTNDKYGIGVAKEKDHQVVYAIEVPLLDENKKVRKTVVPIDGKRLLREEFYKLEYKSKPPTIELFHRHKNWNQTKKLRWHMRVSIPGSKEKIPQINTEVGQRFLAVDVGVRQWANYAVLEVVDENTPQSYPVNTKKGYVANARLVDSGLVTAVNKDTGIDVLNDAMDGAWDKVNEFRNWRTELNTTKEQTLPNISQQKLDEFDSLYESAQPTPGSYSGGLSPQAMWLLEETFKSIGSIESRLDDEDPRKEKYLDLKSHVMQKKKTKNRERVRLIANSLIKLHNEYDCDCVIAEDLKSLKYDTTDSKFTNRQKKVMRPQDTIDQLRQQCDKHKIVFKEVDPRGSSHFDWASEWRWRSRLWKVTEDEIKANEKRWKSYHDTQVAKINKGQIKGYAGAYADFLQFNELVNVDQKISAIQSWREVVALIHDCEYVYIPRPTGHYYLSACAKEPLPADQTAAMCLATRGMKMLAKISERSSGMKMTGTAR